MEKESSPGGRQRGPKGHECTEKGRWGEGSRRGYRPRERPRGGRGPGPPPRNRTSLPGQDQRQATRRGLRIMRAAMHGRPRASARKIKSLARRSARCNSRLPPGNRRWIGPAKAITKRHTSAGTCGDADLERQRAPDGTPRGSWAWAGLKEQRLWANWGRGGCVPTWAKSQVEPLDPEREKTDARSRRGRRPGSSSGPEKSRLPVPVGH